MLCMRSLQASRSFMQLNFDVSVIISTYNQPGWLEYVLRGYMAQDFSGGFEIIVADDGSTESTAKLIKDLPSRPSIPVRHVWQPDQGFQKCRILNKSIAISTGRFILFTDGDCIPPVNMVRMHASRARPGTFLTGGYLKLPEPLCNELKLVDIETRRCFDPLWLMRHGFKPTPKLLKLMLRPPLDRLANRITPTKKTWNGHNSSCHRKDAIAANGFNEYMQYGGEDVEFGRRLNHMGLQGRHLRYSVIPAHLYHKHGYVKPGMRENNAQILRQTIHSRLIRSPLGLDQWLQDDGTLSLAAEDVLWQSNG